MTQWDIRQGDVLERLAEMPDNSVHCVVTSPPYFALRDYGTGQWEGGSAECDHVEGPARNDITPAELARRAAQYGSGTQVGSLVPPKLFRDFCGKCGARRIDRQIGLEATPAEFVQTMVRVFREVRRVLRPDGTCWVNLGDSYAGGPSGGQGGTGQRANRTFTADVPRKDGREMGMKPKDLMMMPARVAIALQDDGWWLRSDIIWCKRAPMPESVTDRPTTAHEHIFLLTKAGKYFYDADAVREKLADSTPGRMMRGVSDHHKNINGAPGQPPHSMNAPRFHVDNGGTMPEVPTSRNAWSYWLLSPEPFPAAHFATFPTEIPRRAILAGTSEHGVCADCGAPWKRVVERTAMVIARSDRREQMGEWGRTQSSGTMVSPARAETTGWARSCTCTTTEVVPCTVLDPFSGAGTTVLVANRLGRRGIGIELNGDYVRMARERIIGDAPLFAWADDKTAEGVA